MTAPFVLIDDARPGGRAILFENITGSVVARAPSEVVPALEALREASHRGLHCAGFLSYEAGHPLEPKLSSIAGEASDGEPPLLWFGLFEEQREIDLAGFLPDPAGAWAGAPQPLVEQAVYEAAVARVKEHIFAGDIYQANLTFTAELPVAGDPLALFASVRPRAQAGHGAVVFTGEHWLLSFSPELFFTLADGKLTARPMKGTLARGGSDAEEVETLREDPKQRAENLMIVDLLRNDLSRVSRPGSVKVPELFAIETYPTVHQMTSTVTAELSEGLDAVDVLRRIFPCGSITGAPKIRAMELIGEMEGRRRGPYSGSIGRLAPTGEAEFNVAIRTLVVRDGARTAAIGLGSGIVADSEPADEWRECLAKGAFLKDGQRRFDLIETMRFDPREGVLEIERHLARMKSSADTLGFAFDRHGARNELQAATFRLRAAARVRLILSQTGAIAIETSAVPETPADAVVALAALPVSAGDFRLRHKTSDRSFYEDAREAAGTFEVLFTDQGGFLTEGSFTNLFVERDGRLLTPPLSRGLLPGVLRARLLDSGEAMEADLSCEDLAAGFYLGNALRGLFPARLAY